MYIHIYVCIHVYIYMIIIVISLIISNRSQVPLVRVLFVQIEF